jgi:hypothetical protein
MRGLLPLLRMAAWASETERRAAAYRNLPMRRTGVRPALLVACLCLPATRSQGQAQAAPGCQADTVYSQLDFWVGNWRVYVGDTLVGTNRISKILKGCAVTEEWQDTQGSRGQSLFYVEPTLHQWKQVWVTEAANRLNGIKEKHLIARLPGGGVRFQGEQRTPGGHTILDRTTLTPLARGEVRQLIEISLDGGTTWQTGFDARYRQR